MDALVHALEAFFVPAYHPMCDGIALNAISRIQTYLPEAFVDGSNVVARTEMLVASSHAAVAFQKGLGAVHGLSEPIGAVHNTHHGLTNAILLPFFLEDMGEAIEDHCKEVAHVLRLPSAPTGSRSATLVIDWVREMNEKLKVPTSLSEIVSLNEAQVKELAGKAARNSTGFTNAVPFAEEDYDRVLRVALGTIKA